MAWIKVRNRLINLDHVVKIEWEQNGECVTIKAWSVEGKKVLDESTAKERLERVIQVLVYATNAITIYLSGVQENEAEAAKRA
jgi:hypothetical protein